MLGQQRCLWTYWALLIGKKPAELCPHPLVLRPGKEKQSAWAMPRVRPAGVGDSPTWPAAQRDVEQDGSRELQAQLSVAAHAWMGTSGQARERPRSLLERVDSDTVGEKESGIGSLVLLGESGRARSCRCVCCGPWERAVPGGVDPGASGSEDRDRASLGRQSGSRQAAAGRAPVWQGGGAGKHCQVQSGRSQGLGSCPALGEAPGLCPAPA